MSIRDGGSLARLPVLKTSPACAWLRGRPRSDQPYLQEAAGSDGYGLAYAVRLVLGDLGLITVACRRLW
jgi:hypothetical protein